MIDYQQRTEVEKAILCCMYLMGDNVTDEKKDALETLFLELRETDFSDPLHKQIFIAITKLIAANKPINLVTLTEILESSKTKFSMQALSEIITTFPTWHDYKTYLGILKKHVITDELKGIAQELLSNAEKDPFLAKEKGIVALSQLGEKTSIELQHYGEALEKAKDEMILWVEGKKTSMASIKTCWSRFNYFAPLVDGEVSIIAARPGVGKTAFVIQLIKHVASVENKKVAFFSLEMNKKQVSTRILLNEMRTSLNAIKNNKYAKKQIDVAVNKLKGINIYLETEKSSLEQIVRACKVQHKRKGLDLIVIDYLQLMKTSVKCKDRRETVDYISRELKLLASELNIPIIALSQLNREVERGDNREPMLSDLRESGAIEQDAYFVMFLHPLKTLPIGYREDIDKQVKAIVAKNRGGAIGNFYLKYIGDQYVFEQIDDKNEVYNAPEISKSEIDDEDNPFLQQERIDFENDDELPY